MKTFVLNFLNENKDCATFKKGVTIKKGQERIRFKIVAKQAGASAEPLTLEVKG